MLAQLDEAVAQSARLLAARGAKGATEPQAAAGSEAAAETTTNPLAALAAARDAAVEQLKAIGDLHAVKAAFSGGLQGGVIAGPLVAAVALAAGLFFLVPGDMMLKAGVAGGVAAVVTGLGLGGGLWFVVGKRKAARTELVATHDRLLAMVADAKGLEQPCREVAKKRRDEQARKLDEQFRAESDRRGAEYETKREAVTAKRDAAHAELELKYKEGCTLLAAKVTAHKDAAHAKYPPRLTTLETTLQEDVATLERERD